MSNTNVVVLTAQLGGEVKFHPFEKGAVAEFSVAINKHRYNAENDDFDTITTWVTLKMFNKLAIKADKYLVKGSKISIMGELIEESWVDKNTGQKRSKLVVICSTCELLNSTKKDDSAQQYNEKQCNKSSKMQNTNRSQYDQMSNGY